MKRMILWIIWIAVAVYAGGISYMSSADARRFDDGSTGGNYSSCTIQAVDGNFSGFHFRYSTHGSCRIDEDNNHPHSRNNQSQFDLVKQIGEAQWTAEGTYNPTTKETTETISVSQKNFDTPGYIATGTIFTTMVCAKDPWLAPDGLSCGSAIPQTTGYIDPQYKAIYPGNPSVPATSRLSGPQRIALNQQYQLSRPVTSSTGITSPNAYNTAVSSAGSFGADGRTENFHEDGGAD